MKLSKYAQYLVFFVAIVLVLAVFAVAAGKGDPAAGKAVYDKRCATCHAAAGEGKPARPGNAGALGDRRLPAALLREPAVRRDGPDDVRGDDVCRAQFRPRDAR